MMCEKTDRIDYDLSSFKNYCNDQKHLSVKDAFKVTEEDVTPDNCQKFEDDIKEYSAL